MSPPIAALNPAQFHYLQYNKYCPASQRNPPGGPFFWSGKAGSGTKNAKILFSSNGAPEPSLKESIWHFSQNPGGHRSSYIFIN